MGQRELESIGRTMIELQTLVLLLSQAVLGQADAASQALHMLDKDGKYHVEFTARQALDYIANPEE